MICCDKCGDRVSGSLSLNVGIVRVDTKVIIIEAHFRPYGESKNSWDLCDSCKKGFLVEALLPKSGTSEKNAFGDLGADIARMLGNQNGSVSPAVKMPIAEAGGEDEFGNEGEF